MKIVLIVIFFPIYLLIAIIKNINKKITLNKEKKYILSTTISTIDCLSGFDFEYFIAKLFSIFGFNAKVTQKSNDYGVDIIAKYKKYSIVIQTKLYFNHIVGNNAIQQIHAGIKFYKAFIGIVVCNSYFSKNAKILAKELGVLLIDRDDLIVMLNNSNFITNKKLLISKIINQQN